MFIIRHVSFIHVWIHYNYNIILQTTSNIYILGLGNISVLSFIVILKCHDNKDFFSIVVSSAQYYR